MVDNSLDQKLRDLELRVAALEKLKNRESIALVPNLSDRQIAELSPRTQALRITAGIDDPHYIGKMSIEAIKTEIQALENIHDYVFQYTIRPVDKVEQQKEKWKKRYDALQNELKKRTP